MLLQARREGRDKESIELSIRVRQKHVYILVRPGQTIYSGEE
jgi:hypothetical protein